MQYPRVKDAVRRSKNKATKRKGNDKRDNKGNPEGSVNKAYRRTEYRIFPTASVLF